MMSEDKGAPAESGRERPGEDEGAANNRGPARSGDSADTKSDGAPGGKGERPLYRKPLFWIALAAAAAAIAIAILLWWLHARQFESTDDAFVDTHIVRLAPQVSGRLIWVAPADNRHVRAGQVLALIEPSGPQAQLEQAQAGIAEAQAGIDQAQGRLIAARAQRAEAAANALVPQAAAARAARDDARYRKLAALDRAAVASTQLDAAHTLAETTGAQAAAARRTVDSASAGMLVAGREVAAARAQLRAARARVAQSRVTIGDLRIVAPVAGQVVNRTVNVGSSVSPETQMMAIVPDEMWITANFKETQLARVRVGQHVDIRLDAFPDLRFDGHVDSIQRGAGQAFAILPPQNATGNYVKVVQRVPVRIRFDHMPDPRVAPIGPGMSASPRVRVR